MKRLIGCVAVLCLLALTVGCGGVTSNGTLAYISNSNGTGFTVFQVNNNGTLTTSTISPVPSSTPSGDGPKVIQFSANGKWAYFLDAAGNYIYAYTRSGNGTLPIFIGQYAVNGASSLVIAPNSTYLYVSLPNVAVPNGKTGELAIFSIDQSTGILTGSQPVNVGYSISQLVMNPTGTLLFGLAPQTVVSWQLNSTSGAAVQSATLSVGTQPDWMILSANGLYMYVLDATATTTITNVANCGAPPNVPPNCNSLPGPSPNFYAYTVGTGGILQAITGTNLQRVFNENADLQTGVFPTIPVGGVTTNDSRYLFIVNFGTKNISVFRINTAANGNPGEPTEVTGSLTVINGISTSTASPFPCAGMAAGVAVSCAGPSFAAVSKNNNALYVVDESPGRIFQFSMNENTGVLRALNPAYVGAENNTSNPTWITIR